MLQYVPNLTFFYFIFFTVTPVLSNLVVSFKLTGEEFNNHLLDSKSQEYINLTKKVTLNVSIVVMTLHCVV